MQSQDHLNAFTSVFHSILTIIAPHAGNLAREMTPVSLSCLHAIFVQVFPEEQQIKIKHRRRYIRKQKASDLCSTSKEDDLDLPGDDVEAFSGSQP